MKASKPYCYFLMRLGDSESEANVLSATEEFSRFSDKHHNKIMDVKLEWESSPHVISGS